LNKIRNPVSPSIVGCQTQTASVYSRRSATWSIYYL